MLKINDVLKLARAKSPLAALRSVVFDGQSAICASELDWMVGVPCPQPHLSGPVVVPVEAVLSHLAKSRHLVVMPDHLSNGKGLVTPFGKDGGTDYDSVLAMLPGKPAGPVVSFDLELNALDRVLVAAGVQDIRYYLNGVLFDLTDGVLVGTDGHRLHLYRNRVPQVFGRELVDGVPTRAPVELVVPRDPLYWVLGSKGESVKVSIWNAQADTRNDEDPAQILLQGEDCFVWIRKPIDGKFPDWARVVPAVVSRPVWASLNPIALADGADAMGKAITLANPKEFPAVRIDFGGGQIRGHRPEDVLPLSVQVHSDDASVAPESLSDALQLCVNARYLQDAADCVTRNAQWRPDYLNPTHGALLVVDGDFSGVVMPYRDFVKPADTPAEPAGEDAQEEAEPCPAAVAALADQLMGKARQSAQQAPAKARKQPRRLVTA